jgi:Uma2 family endonuclease
MATVERTIAGSNAQYPTSDGRPMAETDYHRDLMFDLIKMLDAFFANDKKVYVSGNLLIYYVPGNRRRHLSPDVFVVKGVKKKKRLNYLTWEEGKGPDLVIEVTSSSTRGADVKDKFAIYQDVLKVKEYFLFDPFGDYLKPPLQGHRLVRGKYREMEPVDGRLVSKVIGLHLQGDGQRLRLYDPATAHWLLTPEEAKRQAEERERQSQERERQAEAARRQAEDRERQAEAARRQAEDRERQAEAARRQAEGRQRQAEDRQRQAEEETERIRLEIESLRRRLEER